MDRLSSSNAESGAETAQLLLPHIVRPDPEQIPLVLPDEHAEQQALVDHRAQHDF